MKSNDLKNLIREQLSKALTERQEGAAKSKIILNGEPYKLVLDVNKNPTKKGIKVQFQPQEIAPDGDIETAKMSDTAEGDLQIDILRQLNDGLRKYDLEADIDPDVPYSNVIGFYIHLQYFDKIIREALSSGSNGGEEEQGEDEA